MWAIVSFVFCITFGGVQCVEMKPTQPELHSSKAQCEFVAADKARQLAVSFRNHYNLKVTPEYSHEVKCGYTDKIQ